MIATATWYSAYCIYQSFVSYIREQYDVSLWIVGGGGAHNPVLMRFLQEMLAPIIVTTQNQLGYSSDAKEAIAFLILGNLTWHRQAGNVPSVTGTNKPAVLGKITYPPRVQPT